MKNVLIVKYGKFGQLSSAHGDYDTFIESLTVALQEENPLHQEAYAQVTFVDNGEDAIKLLRSKPYFDSLVFISRSELFTARKIKADFPRLKIVVLTGSLPEDEIAVVDKRTLETCLSMRAAILP